MRLACLAIVAVVGSCKDTQNTRAPVASVDISVVTPSYAPSSDAPPEVVKACAFADEVALRVAKHSGAEVKEVATGGKRLTMEIVAVRGVETDWQGDRAVIVAGRLETDDGEAATFRIRRARPGGLLGGMRDVCRSLDQIAEDMGVDIADWLAAPQTNANL